MLDFFKQHKISWTQNKEVKRDDKVIIASDMGILFNFLLRDRNKRPIDFDQFQELLNSIDFPQEWIKNKYLKNKKTIYARPEPKTPYHVSLPGEWLKM